MNDKLLFIELFRNGLQQDTFPKSKEPDIELLRSFTLLKENNYSIKFLDIKLGNVTQNNLEKEIKSSDYIFINSKTYNRYYCNDLILLSKKLAPNSKIILYGQHPESDPDFFLNKFEDIYIVQKEIFIFLRDFIQNKNIKDLHNVIYKKSSHIVKNKVKDLENLDELPFLDLDYLDDNYYTLYPMKTLKKHKWGFLTLSKGCPFKCVFCSRTLRVSCGTTPRYFSEANAIERIKRLVDSGHNFMRFLDDDWHDKKFIKSICKAIIRENIEFKWMAQVRADSLDLPTLSLMKKAGCECLNIGVESGSERILKELKKDESLDSIRKAFSLCKKLKIYTVGYFMVGSPTETKEDLDLTFDFLKELKPTMLQVAYFTPYPGSPFFDKLPSSFKEKPDFFHYQDIVYNFSEINKNLLRKTMRNWNLWFYFKPDNFIRLAIFRIACFYNNPSREVGIWNRIIRSFLPF